MEVEAREEALMLVSQLSRPHQHNVGPLHLPGEHTVGTREGVVSSSEMGGTLTVLLDDVPGIFCSVAEFAAGHAGAEAEGTNADGIVFERVGKIILALGHGTDEDTYTLFGTQIRHVIPNTDNLGVEAQGDLATIRGQVVSNRILDHFEQFLLGIHGSDGQFVKQLDHETCKSFESPGYSDRWVDLNEDPLGCVDVDLESSSFVDWRIKQGQETLDRVSASDSGCILQPQLGHLMRRPDG